MRIICAVEKDLPYSCNVQGILPCSKDEPPGGLLKKNKKKNQNRKPQTKPNQKNQESAVTGRWGDVSTQVLQEQYIILGAF